LNFRRAASVFLFSAALSAPALAASDPPYIGKWAVEGSKACTAQAGDGDLLLTITVKQLNYYASACTVTSSRRLSHSGNDAHRLAMRCTGEGNTTNMDLILVVLEKNEHRPDLLLHINPSDWAVLSYLRCPG